MAAQDRSGTSPIRRDSLDRERAERQEEYPYDEMEDLERAILRQMLSAYTPAGEGDWTGDQARAEVEAAARAFVTALDERKIS